MQEIYTPGVREESLSTPQYAMLPYEKDDRDQGKSLGDFNVLPIDVLQLLIQYIGHPEKISLRLTSKAFKHIIDETPIPLEIKQKKELKIKSYTDLFFQFNDASKKYNCKKKIGRGCCVLGTTAGSGCAVSTLTAIIAGFLSKSTISTGAWISAGAFGGAYCCLACSGICVVKCCIGAREDEIMENVNNCNELRSSIRRG